MTAVLGTTSPTTHEVTYQDNDDQLYNSPMVIATSSPEKRDTNQMYGALVGNRQSPPQSAYG